ncbi:MAG: archaemetzincin family Zn-dependent metalloprotease [Deltaproteobacteria bacterium]|nr:archaemetzincin family Zn-dependent metalloprotease [Deltaproteobacteria bacterium]
MSIALIAIGNVDREVLETLKARLASTFKKDFSICAPIPLPGRGFDDIKEQYSSVDIIRYLEGNGEYGDFEKVLGVIDRDLYVPGFNFVFGQAGEKASIISLLRLKQEFWGLPEDIELFFKRAITEAVHELGHSYGLKHCEDPLCVMFFSNTISDTDRKGVWFCMDCEHKLGGLMPWR